MIDYMGRGSNCSSRIVCIFLLLLVLFSFQEGYATPEALGKADIQENSILRHIVLNCEKSLSEQLKQSYTIYEVRNSFDLENKKVVIPEGCVLLMMGGSISNGILEGKGTEIVYVAGTFNCQLRGSYNNDDIHVEWFGVKSGAEFINDNDRILHSYVIPSMENLGNTLYMSPQTKMYFSKPLIFDGTYNLDLRGQLFYSGKKESIAVSIGTPSTRVYGKNYNIHSVVSSNTKQFYNEGSICENVGICLWNLKQCNITLDEVLFFGYCVRLCGSIGGCSSNKINFTRIGGRCYYGIHCCSYDTGWVNENTFFGKAILNYSDNPANDVMCAIWFDARDKNTCNANVFYDPCVEGCHHIVKYTNAIYNVIHDVRAEHIASAILSDNKSKNNSLYCKYWDSVGDYSSNGSNRVIKVSDIIPPYPLVFSEQLGLGNNIHYGVCFKDGKLRTSGDIKDGYVFGKIVEVADPSKEVNIEFVFEQPGRYAIVFFNDDYNLRKLDENLILLNSDITIVPIKGGFRSGSNSRRASVNLQSHCRKMLIGSYGGSGFGDVLSMNVYSDNLLFDNLYSSNNGILTLNKSVGIDVFNFDNQSQSFFPDVETILLNGVLNLNEKTISLSNKEIVISKGGGVENGTVDVSGCIIYPNFNALISGANLTVVGMPVEGTYYYQKGKPTWSNGKEWVDSNGRVIH